MAIGLGLSDIQILTKSRSAPKATMSVSRPYLWTPTIRLQRFTELQGTKSIHLHYLGLADGILRLRGFISDMCGTKSHSASIFIPPAPLSSTINGTFAICGMCVLFSIISHAAIYYFLHTRESAKATGPILAAVSPGPYDRDTPPVIQSIKYGTIEMPGPNRFYFDSSEFNVFSLR